MIYLLYSKDKEVIWRYIDKLIQKNNIEENSIIKYTLNEETLHPILEECNTLGLFSIKKLIIVDITLALSNKEDYEEIIKYLDNYNKDIILIFTFFQDKIDTRKKIYKKISRKS